MTDLERELAGALAACVEQIEQMRGMFGDEDGTIAEAVDTAEDALAWYEKTKASPDFALGDHGTITTLSPLTDVARRWIDAHIDDEAMSFCRAVTIEPHYVPAILDGIAEAGLRVA